MYRLLLITAVIAAGGEEARSQPSHLIAFDLRDQFGRRYTEQTFHGVPLAIVGCDRGGSAFGGAWEAALNEQIRGHHWRVTPLVVSVADLRGVPPVLRGFVRRQFPRLPTEWSLLDWNGDFAQAYTFDRNACTILLFSESGRLVGQARGTEPVSGAALALVRRLVSAETPAPHATPADPGDRGVAHPSHPGPGFSHEGCAVQTTRQFSSGSPVGAH